MSGTESNFKQLLELADVKVNGSRPHDITVHDPRLYNRVLRQRELGFGEAYMDGWWDCPRIDELVAHLLSARIRDHIKFSPSMIRMFAMAFFNQQTISRAQRNAATHYNIGNDLYERMLGKQMIYSCAYWQHAKTLDEAQEHKLDLICRKLHLKKGMTLLDIGCGWGGFAEFAASKYGAIVTGISPALEQIKVAKQRTQDLPVTILQKDYREISGKYDRIISIGMLEHVGPKNYKLFFEICDKLLVKNGLMLHHTIGANSPDKFGDPFISKYIFPGGILPDLGQICRAIENRFVIEDLQNFGPDYDKTLMAWHSNFKNQYKEIQSQYNERFYRMWEFYLLICAGAFRARDIQLWQIVMRRIAPSQTYLSAR